MKKQDIVNYLKENEDWILQYCHGIRGDGWWWLRNTKAASETIDVNGNSAEAAAKVLIAKKCGFNERNYSAY